MTRRKNIEESGISYTFLRSGAFMQNFINFFGQTIKTQKCIAAVATEILLAKNNETKSKLQHENKLYNITGHEAISYGQAAEILSNVLGRRISYVNVTEEDARKAMKNTGMEDWFVDALTEL